MSQQNRRSSPQQPQQRPAGQALAQQRSKTDIAVGTYSNQAQINEILKRASDEMHLVSPATSVGRLPEGCGVAITVVHVEERDLYEIAGATSMRGLGKTVLQKIAAALGVSWDPYASRRMDDGSDPYYCHWQAVGAYRSFDGQMQIVQASKEMDLRDGSPQIQGMWQRYQAAQKDPQKRAKAKEPTAQIREMRLHIAGHAETKAQLRAIRSLGIRTSYTLEELKKPFVAARVMFTGETQDPELRRMFAEKTADAFLGARASLYGTAPAPAPAAIHSGQVSPRLASPPAVGSVPVEDDDWVDAPDAEGEEPAQQQTRAPAQEPKAANTQQQQAPAQQQPRGDAVGSDYVLRFGKSKGKTIADAPSEHLEWMAVFIDEKLEAGESQYVEQDRALLSGIDFELQKRAADKEKL